MTEQELTTRRRKCKTAKARCKVFIDVLFACASDELPEEILGDREVDNLFEMGDGDQVVRLFLERYDASPDLQKIMPQFHWYVDVAKWKQRYAPMELF